MKTQLPPPAISPATTITVRAVISPATITTVSRAVTSPVSRAAISPVSRVVISPVSRAVISPVSRAAISSVSRVVISPVSRAATSPVSRVVTSPVSRAVTRTIVRAAIRTKVPVRTSMACPREDAASPPRPKRIEYETPLPDPNEQLRLNKFMANAGLCSRREADEYILKGLIKVNGEVVTELGTKVSHNDVVEYDGKVVTLEKKCYILLNKPKDCVTTSDDPNGRLTVMDLVKGACEERIYPVGRLDRNTTGVLLLTNDGDLASKLTHPKFVKKKIYHVWTDHDITEDDMQRIADGIELEDGPIHADAISYATETDRNQAGIEIHSGRNRIVRRIFESLGYHVTKLDRVYFAGLTKKNLPRGRWRYLTQDEVNYLKMGSFE